MKASTYQRMRAARWGALEGLRESWLARALLGCIDLGRAFARFRRGQLYLALDSASRIGRVLRVPGLARIACRLEERIWRQTILDPQTGAPLPAAENRLVDDFRKGPAADSFRGGMNTWERLVNLGGELMMLKAPDLDTGELGVVIIKYTPAFGRFAALYDLSRLFEHYQVVLEPSWIGYHDPILQLFTARERRVIVEAQFPEDEATLRATGSNLVPVPFGAGHWVDPRNFHPLPESEKEYLGVLIANWAPHKRHHLLLDALAKIDDPTARIALVGYPWKEYTQERLHAEVRRRGLAGRVDFYERINRKEVNEVFNRSHANLLISRKEGASKILYEGLAAGTPCIVLDDHEGARPADINDRTGIRAPACDLDKALEMMRDEGHTFDPRGWWCENASPPVTTERLEAALRDAALAEGRPFTRGLALKTNDPNLTYIDPSSADEFRASYEHLSTLLRPDEEIRGYRVRYQRPEDR
ncbi:MAG: glycosyltransferase [Myxococcales bacterium]|nr:glycosyltransferase [Myxococcales bacterium]